MPDQPPREVEPPLLANVFRPPTEGSEPAVPTIQMSEEMRGAFEGVVVDVEAKLAPANASIASTPRPIGWLIATGVSWAALVAALLFPPAFAAPPADEAFQAPGELREASLRYGLWLARHRVDGFLATSRRLPSYGGEAGIVDPAIIIEIHGERSYSLKARESSIQLQLASEMAADSFLGESLTTLERSEAYQQAGTPGRMTAR